MKKHPVLFLIILLILGIIFAEVAYGIGSALLGILSLSQSFSTIAMEIIIIILIWLINHFWFKAHISWRFNNPQQSWMVAFILVTLVGDSTLHATFNLTLHNLVLAIITGTIVGIAEEYLYRGVLVSFLKQNTDWSGIGMAIASGLVFALVHSLNLLNTTNLSATIGQIIGAVGIGFLFAVIYLITNNLWLPIIAHAIIDAFDQIAFPSLNSDVGNSLHTGLIYFGVYLVAGIWLYHKYHRTRA